MFSRTSAAVVVGLSCLSILASGCFVGEDPPAPKLVGGQIGSFQSSCVAKIPPGVRDYFLGNLQDDNQIGALWDCGISALQAFELLVRSDQPGVIPSKDLLKFLNGYLNEADKLSEDLRLAAMKLKAAFLGGDSDNLTTRELDQTIEILGILKRGTINLKTLMPVLPTHISGLARGQLGGLIATLQSTGVELGSYVAGHGGDYSFDDAGKLLIEFEKVYLKNAAPDNVVRWLREQLPVLRILKSVVVGGSADKVAQSEWLNALGLASKAYGTYMLYVNESDHFSASWFSPDGIDALASIFTRAVDHLAEVGANHPGGVVPAETLSLLVSTLQQTKLHPDPAMASTTTTVTIADLVAKALLVKQAIFGGAGLAFDLNRAVELRPLIANAKRPAYRLYQILLQTDFSNMTDADFAKVVADFEGASTSVTVAVREFMAQAPAVTFSALTGLTQQLDPLFQLPTTHQSVDNAVALASGSRAVLLGPPYAGVQQAEWSPILDEAARLARLYLLTLRAPVPPASGGPSPQQLDYWWSLADSGIAFINDVITRHPAGSPAILTSEVLALLNGLPDSVARKSALLALIPDFMSLKQALFGGDAQGLQAGELVRIQALLAAVKGQSYLLRPYFPLDLSQIGTWTTARVDSLADAFSTATEALAASLGRGATASYSFSQLDGLLVKLSPLLTDPSMIANAREMIPVLSSLKAVILRPPYDSLAPAEWRELISSLGNWGALALRLDHFMSSAPDWYHGDALTRMQALSTELLQNLRNATVNHTPSEIAFG
ncbi:MAG: hypothetical protein HY074_03475, partial [Deltaproteobacteria bacterium]|nr:hypothetical protein [Deltaproteobacteria bacterium]